MSGDMEALRADIMTGRDLEKAAAKGVHLDGCVHCGGEGEMKFLIQKPYVFCKGCGATTACGDTPEEASAKWNRRHA